MARKRPRTRRGLIPAIGLGIVGGMRAGLPAATIALRDRRPRSRLLRFAIVVGSAGELVLDKLPSMPSRTEAPGLAARFASSATVGRQCAGRFGGLVSGATALGSAFVTHNARRDLGKKTGLPDPVIAVAEDSIAIAIARLTTRRPLDAVPPAPGSPAENEAGKTAKAPGDPKAAGGRKAPRDPKARGGRKAAGDRKARGDRKPAKSAKPPKGRKARKAAKSAEAVAVAQATNSAAAAKAGSRRPPSPWRV